MKKRPRCAAAGGAGVGGYLLTAVCVAQFVLLPWEYVILALEIVGVVLLILAAVRAHKRAAALKEEAAEEIGMAQTPKSA